VTTKAALRERFRLPRVGAARPFPALRRLRRELPPGDVLLFRISPEACLKHCAIVADGRPGDPEPRIIHAYWGRAVVESWLGPWWRRRLAHAFSFPDVSD
jgi:NlpC/P60 family putative phage cell wall peptidase